MSDYRDRRKRDRRRAIARQRSAAIENIALGRMGRKAMDALKLSSIRKMAPVSPIVDRAPPVVRDVIALPKKAPGLPRRAAPAAITAPLAPSRRKVLVQRKAAPAPKPLVPPRAAAKSAPSRVASKAAPVVVKKQPGQKMAHIAPQKARSQTVLPAVASKKRSDPPRNDPVNVCKERPKSNAPRSGGGSRKPFVPWCS